MKISIIIPVYNVEKYIRQCIDSVLDQTFKDFELILVDDGSTDSSGVILDEYGGKDPRIRIIHKKNEGVSVARNSGLNIAKGEWITFIDGDDYIKDTFCEEIIDVAERTTSDLVFFSYFTVRNNVKMVSQPFILPEGDVTDQKDYIEKKTITQFYDKKRANAKVSAGTSWGKIIKKDILDENNIIFPPGVIRAQDTVFWLNAIEKSKIILYINRPLYYYRISNINITSGNKFIPDSINQFEKLLNEYNNFIVRNYKDKDFHFALNVRTLDVLYWNFTHNVFNKNNTASFSQKFSYFCSFRNREPYRTALNTSCYKNLPKNLRYFFFFFKHKLYLMSYIIFIVYQNIKSLYKNFIHDFGYKICEE